MRGSPRRTPEHPRLTGDSGQLSILVLGYVAIAIVLIVVGIDASAAFLDRRALVAASDDAAIAAAGGVDRSQIYSSGLSCGQSLPLDPSAAAALADSSVSTDSDLMSSFTDIQVPQTTVAGSIATVRLIAHAALPFGGIIGLVDPAVKGGITVTATSHAQSPALVAGGC